MREIYAALPDDWRLFTEHKMYEPAFYSTVVQDWGTNYIIAQRARAQGLSAWSTSATMRRTSTSR